MKRHVAAAAARRAHRARAVRRGCLLTLAVAAGLLGLAVGALLWARSRTAPWPKPIPGIRLEWPYPLLDRAALTTNDAAYWYLQMTNFIARGAMPRGATDTRSWGWDCCGPRCTHVHVRSRAYVATNTPLLTLLERAVAGSRGQGSAQLPMADSTEELVFQAVAEIAGMDAQLAAHEGAWARASRRVLGILDMAHCAPYRGLPTEYANQPLIVASIALNNMARMAVLFDPPRDVASQWLHLSRDEIRRPMPVDVWRQAECVWLTNRVSEVFNELRSGELDTIVPDLPAWAGVESFLLPLLGSTPKRSRSHLTVLCIHAIDHARRRQSLCPDCRALASDGNWHWIFDDPVARQCVGRILNQSMLADLDGFRAPMHGAVLVLAVRLYETDHAGQAPHDLAALIPRYLSEVPLDPYADPPQPFRYVPATNGDWMVYSVGRNRVDDGGTLGEHRGQGDQLFGPRGVRLHREYYDRKYSPDAAEAN